MWSPVLKAWFPKALDHPDLALLPLGVDTAEYWDAPSSKMVQLAGFVKAMVTGHPLENPGDHGKLNLT